MTYIERTLWFETDGLERQSVKENRLLERPEPLVVLGEPGMGKSRLLCKLAQDAGVHRFTATEIINRPDPGPLVRNRSPVIIDALDEVAARHDGDAVDSILQKLGMLDYPRFVLSCRVRDWRAATSASAISELYAAEPLQLHLFPLTRKEQILVLTQNRDASDAERILSHFESFGLDFLGNPQTLELVAKLPAGDPLPQNSTELFERATEVLRVEHRDGWSEPAKDIVIDAAGAAFAGLILTGSDKISRHASANLEDGEIQFGEAASLAGEHLEHAIGTRLFSGSGDSFSYWHRRIGEFLGAKWLAKRANTLRKRQRLLQIFQSHGSVPANLRGLHAWLAHDKHLAPAVIDADPMGVIEYGDADSLPPDQATVLLASLERVAQENPYFQNWTQPRAGALVQPQLHAEFRRILKDKTAVQGLRMLLAKQLRDAGRAEAHAELLRERLLDSSEEFAIRELAGEALACLDGEDWTAHLEELRCQAKHDSVRLAFELMRHIGIASFSDDQVVEITLALHREDNTHSLARFGGFSEEIPVERLDALLGAFSEFLIALPPDSVEFEDNAIADFVHGLILRRLEGSPVDPPKLWDWLKPCINHHVHLDDAGKDLKHWFQTHDDVRRAIQHHVLLVESGKPIRETVAHLSLQWQSLVPDEGDVVALLAQLDPSDRQDLRWREVLETIPHDGELGQAARDAAKPFAAHDPQMQDWLQCLAKPPKPNWQIEWDEKTRKRAAAREAEFREHRQKYSNNLEEVRSGQFRWVHRPALAYLKKLNNIGAHVPAHERVAEWLGADIAQAAHEGFETFLVSKPVRPSAVRMAVCFAQNRRWNTGDIIVAALAERLRTRSDPFEGLPDERLMAGMFVLWHRRIDYNAGFPELSERIEVELRRREAWEKAHRVYFTPQFKKRRSHIDDLGRFMRSHEDVDLASRLAVEWLEHCADIAYQPEAELIDRVLASALRERLRAIGDARRPLLDDNDRRRNWNAVQVLVDFDAARQRLGTDIEPELLWHIRDRSDGRHPEDRSICPLSTEQIAWVVSKFRGRCPATDHPSGETIGDTNPWDASDFIRGLVARLGNDVSEDAVTALTALRDAPGDGYTDHLRSVAAEQKQKRVEQRYDPPAIQDIATIIDAGPPVDAADLQAVVIDALSTVQAWLKGSRANWYRGFFRENGDHKDEESCRDELIKMLHAIESNLDYDPESPAPDNKRVDIVVRADADLILPIEVKGQWHRDLWTAADKQLGGYINDWRAERGIYLVLWFGADAGLPTVPDGSGEPVTTPEALQTKLHALSNSARAHRLDVVVLDLTQPEPSSRWR